MKVIYKYKIEPGNDIVVRMPGSAIILDVRTQGKDACIWALVDRNKDEVVNVDRHFKLVPTGETFSDTKLRYIGTFHNVGGWMVFHLFEVQMI